MLALAAVLLLAPGAAHAAPAASLTAGFAEGTSLGDPSSASLEVGIAGSEYEGTPLPLQGLTVRFPKGTALTPGTATCSRAVLEFASGGPSECPAGSSAGVIGTFGGWASFGLEKVPEEGIVQAFFAPEGGLFLFFSGHVPVLVEVLAEGHYLPASGEAGPGVFFTVPLVETVPGAPLLSITGLTLRLGVPYEEGAEQLSTVNAPSGCAGELSWSAAVSLSDGQGDDAGANAQDTGACPAAGSRKATTTVLAPGAATVAEGQADQYTARVSAAEAVTAPGGSVSFFDSGAVIPQCAHVALAPSATTGVAVCDAAPAGQGGHEITAVYGGAAGFAASESPPSTVTVAPAGEPPPTHVPSGGEGEQRRAREAAEQRAAEEAARQAALATALAARHHEEAGLHADILLAGGSLLPHGAGARIGALLRRGSYTASVGLPVGVTAAVGWYLVPSGAHISSSAPVLVASGTAHVRGGETRLTIRLTTAGRRLLRRATTARLTEKIALSAPDGVSSSLLKAFRLKR